MQSNNKCQANLKVLNIHPLVILDLLLMQLAVHTKLQELLRPPFKAHLKVTHTLEQDLAQHTHLLVLVNLQSFLTIFSLIKSWLFTYNSKLCIIQLVILPNHSSIWQLTKIYDQLVSQVFCRQWNTAKLEWFSCSSLLARINVCTYFTCISYYYLRLN